MKSKVKEQTIDVGYIRKTGKPPTAAEVRSGWRIIRYSGIVPSLGINLRKMQVALHNETPSRAINIPGLATVQDGGRAEAMYGAFDSLVRKSLVETLNLIEIQFAKYALVSGNICRSLATLSLSAGEATTPDFPFSSAFSVSCVFRSDLC
jgi:hypothetical protein